MGAGVARSRPPHRLHARLAQGLRASACLALVVVLAGCSTYASESARIKTELVNGSAERALGVVGKVDDENVLGLLQRGLLLFYSGQNVEAAQTFDRAYQRIDYLYGTNFAQEALSFLTNDAQRDYTGYPAEQILLHTYASLAYLAEGDLDRALIESRRASTRLTVLDDVRVDKKGYGDDAFAQWISAMLYAEDGDANSCLVASRRAMAAFREYATLWGQEIPANFVRDYTVWARRFGFPEEALELEEEFGEIARLARAPLRDEGEVVLVFESGWVDHLEEARIDWPVLEGDDSIDDDDERARRIYRRGSRHHYVVRDDGKLKYWLSIAMPTLIHTEPEWHTARLSALDLVSGTEPVQPVSKIFSLTFEEGSTARLLRTIARGIAKYSLVQAVRDGKKKDDGSSGKNEVAGFLANLFTSATERADTRSWTTLPDTIHLARLTLPAGTHSVTVEVLDRSGRVAQTATYDAVTVVAGSRTLLHHRSYR